MPDDFFQILDSAPEPEDLLQPTEDRYYECGLCALQPGSPALCHDCLERRDEHSETGRTRQPISRSLTEGEQRRYLTYLRQVRDNEGYQAPVYWTAEDLDREFPTRNEPRQEPWRRPSNPPPMLQSYWHPEVVTSRIGPDPQGVMTIQEDALQWRREVYAGLNVPLPENGIQPGEVLRLDNRPNRNNDIFRSALETLRARFFTTAEVAAPPQVTTETRTVDFIRMAGSEEIVEAFSRPDGVSVGVDLGAPGTDETVVTVVSQRGAALNRERQMGMVANFGLMYGDWNLQEPVPEEPEAAPVVEPTSRFEREPEVSDGPTLLAPLPETREKTVSLLSREAISYITKGRGFKSDLRAAGTKLFGELDDQLPTRYERLVWEK